MPAGTSHAQRFGSLGHLAGRFAGTLWPAGPRAVDERWALAQLLPGERELWQRMPGPDRRHAVHVARETLRLLERADRAPPREVLAAALLHDVGKVEANLGALSRTAVTVAAGVLGTDRLGGGERAVPRRLRARARRYLEHDRIGGELLRAAGSDELTIAWAEQHHLAPERWTIDPATGRALKAADGG